MSSQNRALEAPNRWERRPLAAWLVRVLVFALPVASGVGAAWVASLALPPATSPGEAVVQWALLVSISLSVLLVVDVMARRLLPLSALLRLSVLFPGRAPSRFRVALRAGSVRGLERKLAAARDNGDTDLVRHAELVLALATSISGHDRKTRGHSERVRAYAELIAEEMGLAHEDREKLRWAALLHDVGKLIVPTDVLNKDGRPDEREWAILRAHPEAGARIAGPLLDWLDPWGDTIAQHHERVDGAGYPRGLEGDEICLGARIVSVADAYETMTSARSYKQPVSPAAARAELAACAGSQFDPEVVRVFMNVSVAELRHVIAPVTAVLDVPFVRSLSGIAEPVMIGATTAAFVTTLTLGGSAGPSTAAPPDTDVPPASGEREAAADTAPIRVDVSQHHDAAERRATPAPQTDEPDAAAEHDDPGVEPTQPRSAPSGDANGDEPADDRQTTADNSSAHSAAGDPDHQAATDRTTDDDTPDGPVEPPAGRDDAPTDTTDADDAADDPDDSDDADDSDDEAVEPGAEDSASDDAANGPPLGVPPGPPDRLPPGPPTQAPPVDPPADAVGKASLGRSVPG